MHRRLGLIAMLVAVLFPFYSFAETGRAGFPAASIWLSTTAPLSGQSVTVYAVVYNSTANKLDSTLTFNVDSKALSTMAVSLASGASQIYSTQWVAAEGTHAFSATLSGATVSDVVKETGSVSITVAPPPPPSATQQAVAQTTNIVNTLASTSIPVVSKITQALYNTAESLRQKGLDTVSAASGEHGAVLGTSTQRSFPVLGEQKKTGFIASVYAILIMIFASRIYFYPILLILILIVLWLLMRWVNRPRF